MHLFEGACFLCSWASETDGLHDPAHAIPAVAGCSNCLLDTFLDTLGVHPDLGDAVHHSSGDLCNASPAFSILTDSIIWFTFRLHRRQFAEDVFNAILVNLAVFSLDSDPMKDKGITEITIQPEFPKLNEEDLGDGLKNLIQTSSPTCQ